MTLAQWNRGTSARTSGTPLQAIHWTYTATASPLSGMLVIERVSNSLNGVRICTNRYIVPTSSPRSCHGLAALPLDDTKIQRERGTNFKGHLFATVPAYLGYLDSQSSQLDDPIR
ncbi:unnamed protein product [Fusarium graminearum]|uniref:Chromosome 3, complete genome n=1 Tax=Gibberella zeae (strain ATCC MYA-4620 / CBS 123657 / FGSC 9075 / NRRL 31084 / PH-1) TaxID=229533 RepID=I1S7A4_GIBZE|nr:hypothetical protein FGSG_12727 [Fusarium graminearum PH-1]ESU11340.1 hypothetical protein FGSG_12727 [Fusarium graminearum PH-1]CEF88558.1 unnamed protein product [Fusarium graminearum]CZS83999.1 unnamed protein product [Fusarium graminearum]|eukprot:XP_011323916.1 hypothetical protein FGSG_12727 [Fusarium graminearum PH-1]